MVLNEADAPGRDNQEAIDSLREIEGLEIAPLLIGRRKAFPNASSAGLSVLEWHDPKAIDEFGELMRFMFGVSRRDIGGYRMSIVKNPKRLRSVADERKAEEFISGAQQARSRRRNKKPTMIRLDPNLMERIDRGAQQLGISRSAFIATSASEKLTEMGL